MRVCRIRSSLLPHASCLAISRMAAASQSAPEQASLDNNSAELLLALTPGVGPRLRKKLLEHFSSATAVMNAAASDLRAVPGIGQKLSRSIVTARQELN